MVILLGRCFQSIPKILRCSTQGIEEADRSGVNGLGGALIRPRVFAISTILNLSTKVQSIRMSGEDAKMEDISSESRDVKRDDDKSVSKRDRSRSRDRDRRDRSRDRRDRSRDKDRDRDRDRDSERKFGLCLNVIDAIRRAQERLLRWET